MEYRLLGALTVRRRGVPVPVPPGKQRVLLAALLLRAGQPASMDELAEALWGPGAPPSARASLQNYVRRLRQALEDGSGPLIVTEPAGYLIRLQPGELDVYRFESALATGRSAARAQAWAEAAAVLRGGLALWRGDPLADVRSETLAAREVPRLAELRMQALEARIDADLHLGRHAEVIAELRQLAAAEPLRERLHALLMLALYRDGQQAAALSAYQAARGALIRELGAEPGPELQRLHQQVLAGAMTAPPAALTPAAPPALELRCSLPPDAAAFTGRGSELRHIMATVAEAAGDSGVVAIRAIDGMPGVGKTALAVHAAYQLRDRFPDRQLFIDLHGHTPGQDPVTPEDALAGLLSAIGVDPRSLPEDLAGRAALWRDRMAGQRALVVLDNAATSEQVAPLLPGGDGCLVLVTSRRHLADLPGTVVPVLLDTLPPGQAREMFRRLAPRAAAAPAAAVADLAKLAGFLPLAVSLLARVFVRHPAWTLADLAAETRASLLTLTAEQDSVSAAFAVSYHHLDPGLQQFFRCLGLHPGTTADAYAAAALAGVPVAAAARCLDVLHGEGLLTETGYRRYGMHDLIRRFARDRAAGDSPAARAAAVDRLLGYYQRTAARADACLARHARPSPPVPARAAPAAALPDLPDSTLALAWLRAERANLFACLDRAGDSGQPAWVVGLSAAMASLLRYDGPWAEAVARHLAAVAAARQVGDRPGLAGALNNLGIVRRLIGDYPGATLAIEEALATYQGAGDRLGQAYALISLGALRRLTGDNPGAAAAQEEALAISRELGDRGCQGSALNELGVARRLAGNYPGAAAAQEEALAIARELGRRVGQANALLELGLVRRATGDDAAATLASEEALAIYRELGDRLGQANVLNCLGTARRLTGDYPAAARVLGEALEIYCDLGNRLGQAGTLGALAVVWRAAGDYPGAARVLTEALGIYGDLGDPSGQTEMLNEAGTLHQASGDLRRSADCYQQALELARVIGSPWDEATALAGLGRCALAAGAAASATAGLREARVIFERIGAPEAAGIAAELDALTPAGPAA